MAEDAAEPGSRKGPQRSESRSAKATLTGFSYIGVIGLFRCMRLGDATFSMSDWTPAELAKAALEARR